MITLPPAFEFSQSSLQDFIDCPRRFQLRHLMQQQWPAPPAEPLSDVERAEQLGKRFHLLMERHWLDIPIERDQLDSDLVGWWDAFISYPPAPLPGSERRPEIHTSGMINGQRLVATFDLLAYDPGGTAVLVDWKTSRRRPSRAQLDRRLQTVVYPFLLVESAARLLKVEIKPENVRLIYWFANVPDNPEVFQYSAQRYEEDRRTLALLIDQIIATDAATWPLTDNLSLCRLCQYRSLNDRGSVAGSLDELDVLAEADFAESPGNAPSAEATTEPNDYWL